MPADPLAAAKGSIKDAAFILNVLALGKRAPDADDIKSALYHVERAAGYLNDIPETSDHRETHEVYAVPVGHDVAWSSSGSG